MKGTTKLRAGKMKQANSKEGSTKARKKEV